MTDQKSVLTVVALPEPMLVFCIDTEVSEATVPDTDWVRDEPYWSDWPPEVREQIVGLASVKEVFSSPKFGDVAGCIVSEGYVKRSNPIRVLRDNVVIYEGELESLRRFKDNVNDVRSGTECGIGVKNYSDVQVGDQIECFERIEVARTLD